MVEFIQRVKDTDRIQAVVVGTWYGLARFDIFREQGSIVAPIWNAHAKSRRRRALNLPSAWPCRFLSSHRKNTILRRSTLSSNALWTNSKSQCGMPFTTLLSPSFLMRRDRFSHDKKVHVIPRKAEKPFLSTMRQDFARFVNAPDYADILITSSSYEQFQLIYLLGRDNNVRSD